MRSIRMLPPIISLSVVTIIVGCFSGRPWRRAEEVTARLRCNMTLAEIVDELASYRRVQIHKIDRENGLYIAYKGNTSINLWLEDGRLKTYQTTWTWFVTNIDSSPKIGLCSGTKTVDLRVYAPATLAGAVVWLDGLRAGELTDNDYDEMTVPLGVHELRIEQHGKVVWTTTLRYDESSSGWAWVEVNDDQGTGH